MGMTGYNHQCIPGYAHIAAPLIALTRKHVHFRWGDEEQAAFDALRDALCTEPVMRHPDPAKPYILHTDASDFAVGAILTQEDEGGVDRPVQYISKTLSESQRKWAAIVKEAYAIVYALGKLRTYLQGAKFVVYTDHKPLKSLFKCEIKNTMVQRWAMMIAEFGCEIRYRPGRHNVRTDMLSRIRPGPTRDRVMASLQSTMRELDAVGKEQQQQFPAEWAEAEASSDDDGGGDYALIDGCLYSLLKPYTTATECPRLVVPHSERKWLIVEAHVETGHRSALLTLRYLQAYAVWPGMAKDVKAEIAECACCEVN